MYVNSDTFAKDEKHNFDDNKINTCNKNCSEKKVLAFDFNSKYYEKSYTGAGYNWQMFHHSLERGQFL